jgi:hypothetical protein
MGKGHSIKRHYKLLLAFSMCFSVLGYQNCARPNVIGMADPRAITPAATTTTTGVSQTDEIINVENFGAVGDGTSDDSQAIKAAMSAAYAVDGTVNFQTGKTYNIRSTTLDLTGNINIELNGATIFQQDGGHNGVVFMAQPLMGTPYQLNRGSSIDETSVTLFIPGEHEYFNVGDYVYICWGLNSYDVTQPYSSNMNQIKTIDTIKGIITLTRPIPHDWTVYNSTPRYLYFPEIVAGRTKTVTYDLWAPPLIQKVNPWTGWFDGSGHGKTTNGVLRQVAGSEVGIYLNHTTGNQISDVTIIDSGAAAVVVANSDNIKIDGLTTLHGTEILEARSQAVNIWSTSNIIMNKINDQGINTTGSILTDPTTKASAMMYYNAILVESQSKAVTISNSVFAALDSAVLSQGIAIDGQSEVTLTNNLLQNFYSPLRIFQNARVSEIGTVIVPKK